MSGLYSQYSSIYAPNAHSTINTAMNVNEDSSDEELLDACKQFEQYFVEKVIKQMKDTIPKDELTGDNEYMSAFEDQFVEELAGKITDSGQLGLAQQMYESMSRQYGNRLNLEE